MAEIRTVTTLRSKEAEIVRAIAGYEKALSQARSDLAHIRAAIAIFDRAGVDFEVTPYTSLRSIFGRSEMITISLAALKARGPQTTRELARACIAAKGLNADDPVLETTTMLKVVQALRRAERAGRIAERGKRRSGCIVWASCP